MPIAQKKWTIIFLVSAENNLINESIKAIEEIYRAGSSEHVKFLIIFDGLEYGKFSKKFARPSLYEVSYVNGFFIEKPVYTHRSENLSSKSTLIDFLRYAKRKFPAKNYGFFYKGHGGSGETDITSGVFMEKLFRVPSDIVDMEDKVESFIVNRLSANIEYEGLYEYRGFVKNKIARQFVMAILNRSKITRSLSYHEIAYCIKTVFKQKIGFICLDCCWGQQIENAYIFSGATENIIASADESPALGIGYLELCTKINQRPHIKPEEVANLIVAVYFYRNYSDYDSPVAEFRKMGVSITNIRTANLAKNRFNKGYSFEEKMKEFCDYMIKNIKRFVPIILPARNKCKDYTYKNTEILKLEEITYPIFNIDLPWFLTNLRYFNRENDAELDKLINELQLMIETELISGFLGSNYKKPILGNRTAYSGGNGLSIIFPVSKVQAEGCESLYKKTRHPFYKNCNWLVFLKSYYKELDKINKSTSYKKIWPSYNKQNLSNSFFELENSGFKSAVNKDEFTYNRFKTQLNASNDNVSDWSEVIKPRKKVNYKKKY